MLESSDEKAHEGYFYALLSTQVQFKGLGMRELRSFQTAPGDRCSYCPCVTDEEGRPHKDEVTGTGHVARPRPGSPLAMRLPACALTQG